MSFRNIHHVKKDEGQVQIVQIKFNSIAMGICQRTKVQDFFLKNNPKKHHTKKDPMANWHQNQLPLNQRQQPQPLHRRLLRRDVIELREQGVVAVEVRFEGHAAQDAHGDIAWEVWAYHNGP